MPVIMLRHLEKECGRPIYEMFDYVCGTSTGALLTGMVFVRRMELSKTEELYRDLSAIVFKKPNLLGLGQFFLSQAFYDSTQLERLIRKEKISELRMYETSADALVPRVREKLVSPSLSALFYSLSALFYSLSLSLSLSSFCFLPCILAFILLLLPFCLKWNAVLKISMPVSLSPSFL